MVVWKQLEDWRVVSHVNPGLCTLKNSFPTVVLKEDLTFVSHEVLKIQDEKIC